MRKPSTEEIKQWSDEYRKPDLGGPITAKTNITAMTGANPPKDEIGGETPNFKLPRKCKLDGNKIPCREHGEEYAEWPHWKPQSE